MKDVEKIKAREAKQLTYWQNAKKKKEIKGYLGVILILCGMIRLVDEFATSVSTSMQSAIATEFYPGMSLAEAVGQYGAVGTILTVFSIVAVFLVVLADKYGRKRLLVFSAVGMGIGMFLCAWSPDYTMHLVGRAVVTLFISTDFHVLYMTEAAPDDKRSTFLALASVFGYAGVMLVSVGRVAFTSADGTLNWRGVYLIPAVAAIVLGVLMLTFSNEPKVFIESRIAQLSVPYEERVEKAKEKKGKEVGLGYALKYIFKHKQTRAFFFVGALGTMATMAFYAYYEGIMTEAWGNDAAGTAMVSQALLMYPIGSAVMAMICGRLGDKKGRKFSCIVAAIAAFVGLFLFIMGARSGWNPYLVGLLYGVEIGSFWAFLNTMGIAKQEVIPTEIRGAATTVSGLLVMPFTIISGIVIGILIAVVDNISMVCLLWGAITLGLATALYAIFGKETKDTDLNNVISD